MIDRLKEYIEKDEIYQDYKKNKLMNASDFEKFCIQHCKDIEELLEENEELKKQLEEKLNHKQLKDLEKIQKSFIELKSQQQEFIKYLEDEIIQRTPKARWKHYNEDGFNDYDVENGDYIENQPANITLEKVLQKYREITGTKEGK